MEPLLATVELHLLRGAVFLSKLLGSACTVCPPLILWHVTVPMVNFGSETETASSTRGVRVDASDLGFNSPRRVPLETQLALPLLIQVAQQREVCVLQRPNAPLKLLAGLHD